MSLDVRPGEVHGLIGPNGAGKTTLIDAVTGFVRTSSGEVHIGDVEITKWSPRRRATRGLSHVHFNRSSYLRFFITIGENLAVSGDTSPWHRCLSDFLWPGRIELGQATSEALRSSSLNG